MTSAKLSLREVVALGVGGIIGGGIFAVLGVAASISGNAAFLSYLLAGVIALLSGYSYVRLTRRFHQEGGSFTFLENYTGNIKVAGLLGWILIVGYIGTMAMYAYAFGSFAAGLTGAGTSPMLRGLLSVGVIVVFMLINLLGVRETGASEEIMVYGKVTILVGFAVAGLWGILHRPDLHFFSGGILPDQPFAPLIAVGAIFVSFEGFQLLAYEYREMERGIETLKKGIVISIVLSTIIYVLVSLVTTQLVTAQQILAHKETILAFAATVIFQNQAINQVVFVLVSVAALFSTASAINATLFGTARLGYRVAKERALPSLFSFRDRRGIPTHSLLLVGALTAVFTFLGSLEEITTFASVAFIVVFGVVNALCLLEEIGKRTAVIPAAGVIGTGSALVFLLWHLSTNRPEMLLFIAAVFTLIALMEFVYSERSDWRRKLSRTRV